MDQESPRRLSARARAVLAFIIGYQVERGYPPTIREIGARFGMASTNGPRYYLQLLAAEGYVVRAGGLSRALRVTEAGRRTEQERK